MNTPVIKAVKTCTCKAKRYIVPRYKNIPKELRKLTLKQIVALHPLTIHCGDYVKSAKGYRKKGSMFRVSWSAESVQDKVAALPHNDQAKCQTVYDWLMSNNNSTYRTYVIDRERAILRNEKFNFYDYNQRKGIECALWPSLYPYSDWCDSTLDGRETRLSSKVSYMIKVN